MVVAYSVPILRIWCSYRSVPPCLLCFSFNCKNRKTNASLQFLCMRRRLVMQSIAHRPRLREEQVQPPVMVKCCFLPYITPPHSPFRRATSTILPPAHRFYLFLCSIRAYPDQACSVPERPLPSPCFKQRFSFPLVRSISPFAFRLCGFSICSVLSNFFFSNLIALPSFQHHSSFGYIFPLQTLETASLPSSMPSHFPSSAKNLSQTPIRALSSCPTPIQHPIRFRTMHHTPK